MSNGSRGTDIDKWWDATPKITSRPFTYATTPLPPLVLSILEEKYNLGEEDFVRRNIKWCEELESIMYPCYDFDGSLTGIVTKRLFGKVGVSKSLLFWDNTPPSYYISRKSTDTFPYIDKSTSVWLVEDCLSSMRLYNAGLYSVALLGTHLTESLAVELSKRFSGLVVCLDPDATVKAAAIAANHRLLFDRVKIVVPKKDPKDLSRKELEVMLSD